jgi:hypothetical protein
MRKISAYTVSKIVANGMFALQGLGRAIQPISKSEVVWGPIRRYVFARGPELREME